jgi:MFS family permease
MNNFSWRQSRTVLMVLMCTAYLFDYADRMVVSSLLPMIKAEWHSTDAQLGMLTSIVSLFIAIFVLPLSILVDRWSRTKMISIMVLLWSLATLMSAIAKNYDQLLLTRAFTGIGEAAYTPATIALIAMLYPLANRAKFTGIWNAFAPLGAAVGFVVGGFVGNYYGWRHALGLLALPGFVIAIIFWFAHDYKTQAMAHDENGSPVKFSWKGIVNLTSELFRIRTLWFIFGAFAMNMAINSSILTWLPSYLIRSFGMNDKLAGTMAGLFALLALVGAPLGGWWADSWMKSQAKARMYLPAIFSMVSSCLLMAALLVSNVQITLALILVFGFSTAIFLAPSTAAIQDVVKPGVRALSIGFNVVIMNIGGSFWAPVFVGSLSDKIGLDKALLVLPFMGVIATSLFYFGAKHYAKEIIRN